MHFSSEQREALAAPLLRDHVRTREQSGRALSYIEAWHAIAEANRIFGFDGWSRETIELKCVAEKERAIGKQGAQGYGVSYIAKVRVTIGDIVREGCGTGHGIDRDLGQAHESALKEAESDAMKRALMTFGNPFGLALYDKGQSNVVQSLPKRENPHVTQPRDVNEFEVRNDENGEMIDCIPVWKHRDVDKLRVVDARPLAETLLSAMRMCKAAKELTDFADKNAREFAKLPEKWIDMYQGEYQKLLDELRQERAA